MYGDLSRLTFHPDRHFSAVVVQQGRVTLDADANEQAALERHYARTLATDLIGSFGGPAHDLGFAITASTASSGGSENVNVSIGPGRYYVYGILCELDEQVDYGSQPNVPATVPPMLPALEPRTGYVAYLKVWERYVSYIERPSLREVALGLNGPDTAGRLQVVWQVFLFQAEFEQPNAQDFVREQWPLVESELMPASTARLKARATQPEDVSTNACVLPSSSGYRGPENQLYRVEIHRGGSLVSAAPKLAGNGTSPAPVLSVPKVPVNGVARDEEVANGAAPAADAADASTPTFMWSRDNGSVTFPITDLSGDLVTLATLGRDPQLSLEVGDYVQIIDDVYEAQGEPGLLTLYDEPLHQVEEIVDPIGRIVRLDAPPKFVGQDQSLHPFLRRWDQQEDLVLNAGLTIDSDDHAIQVVEGTWIALEDGVQIWFERGGSYRAGDYWLIPARVATGDVEWPQQAAGAGTALLPPFGVYYYLAPLAVLPAAGGVIDVRSQFSPLATVVPPGG